MLQYRISLFESINFKGLHEYFHTAEGIGNIRPKAWKHDCPVPLMYFTLHRMALKAQAADIAKGSHYCHDCSSEARKPVYHGSDENITAFKQKYSNAIPYLQRIQTELL